MITLIFDKRTRKLLKITDRYDSIRIDNKVIIFKEQLYIGKMYLTHSYSVAESFHLRDTINRHEDFLNNQKYCFMLL